MEAGISYTKNEGGYMIIDLQRRLAEAGRIRIGQQVASSNGKSRPAKLDTFRLTSPDRLRIQQAAKRYGGTPAEWQAPAGPQWEVVTEADALNVIVPPSDMAFSQFYELWSGGGCQRRCDGRNESISEAACICDPDNRECSIHTRLSVMLADLSGLGVWRIDTQGYYAALELQGAVEVIQMAAGRGQMLPARLRLEQRMVKRPGVGTRRFAVPVLDIEVSPAKLLSGASSFDELDAGAIAIEAPRKTLTPVPESVPHKPVASVAEQASAIKERKPRRNSAAPIPNTGLAPRTVVEVAAEPESPPLKEPQQADLDLLDGIRMITAPQLKKLAVLLNKEGLTGREERHDWVASAIGRPIISAKELTITEASDVINILENTPPQDA